MFARLKNTAITLSVLALIAGAKTLCGQSAIDPKSLYEALSGLRSPKSQFETTAEYQQRIADVLHKEIVLGVSLESPLPFLLAQTVAGANLAVVRFIYDADSENLKIGILPLIRVVDMEGITLKTDGGEVGQYTGQNAFGATTEVSRMHSEDYGIAFRRDNWIEKADLETHIPRDQARVVYSHLQLVLIAKVVQPYAVSQFQHVAPTLDSPIDSNANENLITVEPIELRLYDGQTGQLLKTFTENSLLTSHKLEFPIHLEVESNFFTQEYLYYQLDDSPDRKDTGIYTEAFNGGKPFLVVDAKSQVKVSGMDKRTLSKLVFKLNGQMIKPNWYPEKYVFMGQTFANYSAIIRSP